MPPENVVRTIVRAGQQAPFASQAYSILLSRDREHHPYKAPLLFTICVDYHKFERIMEKRGWKMMTNDLVLLFFGIQDAALVAENMVIAARSLGLGSCFLGSAMFQAEKNSRRVSLAEKGFPTCAACYGLPG
ncbi:MAG: nitroreductase family protein [Candidatus Bathyarchaeia archaeon]